MMKTKMIEIRDKATCIATMAILLEPGDGKETVEQNGERVLESFVERRFLWKAGFGGSSRSVYLIDIAKGEGNYDPFRWSYARTMREAHLYIQDNWDSLKTGDVVDVEFILGEKNTKKVSEIL